jgi:hypothetical protein
LAAIVRRAWTLAAFVTLAPLAAGAQVRTMSAEVPAARKASPVTDARESVISLYGELQSISGHLQRVHERALQDGSLRLARDQLMRAVQQAMDEEDPELPRLFVRAGQIAGEMQGAQQRGDAARYQALEHERAQLQARFMRVRATVMRQPEIARQSRAYEEQLRGRMIQIEPLTENLLARSRELQRQVQETLAEQEEP